MLDSFYLSKEQAIAIKYHCCGLRNVIYPTIIMYLQ